MAPTDASKRSREENVDGDTTPKAAKKQKSVKDFFSKSRSSKAAKSKQNSEHKQSVDEKTATPKKDTKQQNGKRHKSTKRKIVIDDSDDEDVVEVAEANGSDMKEFLKKEKIAEPVDDKKSTKADKKVKNEEKKAEDTDDVVEVKSLKKEKKTVTEKDEDEDDEVAKTNGNENSDEDEDEEMESPKEEKKPKSVKDLLSAPKAEKFELSSEATWKPGKPVPYKYLAEAFAKVEAITGRLAIQAILTDVFRVVIDTTPEDLVAVIYLSINKLAPNHEGLELGIGESILLKGLSQVTGRSVQNLKKEYKDCGDLGDLAAKNRATQKTLFPVPPLTVRKVFKEFKDIAKISGKNTQGQKTGKITKLLAPSSKVEAKFLIRALLGKLRIHLAEKTVVASLAAAMVLKGTKRSSAFLLNADGSKKKKTSGKEDEVEADIKEAANILQNVYSQLPVWDRLVPAILERDAVDEDLKKECKLVPGIPVQPMLAKPTKSISEVLDKFTETEFTCEYKYDGERGQVHRLESGKVHVYSRNAENLTPKYPDLVGSLPLALKDGFKDASFILDGESVAYDTEKKKILPFQVLQGRKRKDVDEKDITVKVCFFAFDILFFNGTNLIGEPLKKRREVLTSHFVENDSFLFAKGHDTREIEDIQKLLDDSVKEGCEGLMVKALVGELATYEPANRTQNWLKVKKDYLDGCGDTLDLVPIGGYIGRGKRTGTFGAFLLACYDPDSEEYQSICKVGTGFSDENLEDFAKFYNDSEHSRLLDSPKSYFRVPENKKLMPDKWFEPSQVWEVLCADLSISPEHQAAVGLIDEDKGIALRFPRFLRVRDDKNVEDATSAEQVAELYQKQSVISNNAGGGDEYED